MARPTEGYSRTQIFLHWAVALLILQQYFLRDGIVAFYDAEMEAALLASLPLAIAHIAAGALILVFALWRLVLRSRHGVPPAPEGSPAWQHLAARLTHTAIYAALILLPVTGLLTWLQVAPVSDIASEAHEMLQMVLLGLIALHVAGAAYGQFVRKTDVILRMLRPVR